MTNLPEFRLLVIGGPLLRKFVVAGAIGVSAVFVGGAAAYGYTTLMIGAAVVVAGVWAGWRHLAYLLPALLLLLMMNAIPGLNMNKYVVPGSFRPEDVFVIGLIMIAAGRMLLAPRRRLPRLQQYLWMWTPVFLLVWLMAMIRGIDAGTPWLKAALFGRDFLYFAVLAPLAGYLFANRKDSQRFCLLIGIWTGMFSILMILANLRIIGPSIVNPYLTNEAGPITRLYTPMTNLVIITFTLSLAYALLATGRGRRWATMLAMLTGLACVLSLTRALYVGLSLGIAVSAGIWVVCGGLPGRRLRHRLTLMMAALGTVVVIGLVTFPKAIESGPVSTVGTRIGSGVADLTGSRLTRANSTLAVRKNVASDMVYYLGSRWPLGLGFVPPSTRYVSSLPHGSIRDPDVGVLNGVMTMGVLGTILLYVPILLMLGMLLKRSAERPSLWSFAWLGLMLWGVAVVTSSVTLVFLYTTTGLVTAALVLGYAGQTLLSNEIAGERPAVHSR